MYINEDMHCCGLQELGDLQEYDSPQKAMLAFLGQVFTKNRYTKTFDATNIGNIYIFSGVERVTNNGKPIPTYRNGEKEPDYDPISDRYPVKIKYASEFASFIKKNDFGLLRSCPAKSNRLNHPNHMVKCWIWCPNIPKLKAWYTKHFYK